MHASYVSTRSNPNSNLINQISALRSLLYVPIHVFLGLPLFLKCLQPLNDHLSSLSHLCIYFVDDETILHDSLILDTTDATSNLLYISLLYSVITILPLSHLNILIFATLIFLDMLFLNSWSLRSIVHDRSYGRSIEFSFWFNGYSSSTMLLKHFVIFNQPALTLLIMSFSIFS